MTLTDTHAHIYLEAFNDDLDQVVLEADQKQVRKIYIPNIDASSIDAMHAVEAKFSNCFSMMGLHPCSVKENYREELLIVKDWLIQRPYAAVGEIGIDLYWDKTFVREQEEAFRQQIEWAIDYHYPVVIHSRDSLDLTIEIVKDYRQHDFTGIFHCFTGTIAQAKDITDMGFYVGIGGVLTYKNSGLDSVVKHISPEYIVLETDSPYLSPVPYRGKRNQPAYIWDIAQKLAQVLDLSIEEVGDLTTANAKKIFHPYTLSP